MFSPSRINQALDHQNNFRKGKFSDEDLTLLYQYWWHLLEITNGVEGLGLISSYATHEMLAARSIMNARGLPISRSSG